MLNERWTLELAYATEEHEVYELRVADTREVIATIHFKNDGRNMAKLIERVAAISAAPGSWDRAEPVRAAVLRGATRSTSAREFNEVLSATTKARCDQPAKAVANEAAANEDCPACGTATDDCGYCDQCGDTIGLCRECGKPKPLEELDDNGRCVACVARGK